VKGIFYFMNNTNATSDPIGIFLCPDSFEKFCRSYIIIDSPYKAKRYSWPVNKVQDNHFYPYKYQTDLIKAASTYNRLIVKKFRQGGFSTTLLAWLLWSCLKEPNQKCLFVSHSQRSSEVFFNMAKKWLALMPPTIKSMEDNKSIVFSNNSMICFQDYNANEYRGYSPNFVVMEEMNCLNNSFLVKHIFDSIATADHIVAISSISCIDDWFYKTYRAAEKKENDFTIFNTSFYDHPDFCRADWILKMKQNVGEKNFKKEFMCLFGDEKNYIPPFDIRDRDTPDKLLFADSKGDNIAQCYGASPKDIDDKISKLREERKSDTWKAEINEVSDLLKLSGLVQDIVAEKEEPLNEMEEVFTFLTKNIGDDFNVLKLAGVIPDGITSPTQLTEDEIDYNYLILQKATEGVSEKMSLSYHKNRLCINKVPTKISANGIRMAFTGLSEFLGK
jgi:hypothetical protein